MRSNRCKLESSTYSRPFVHISGNLVRNEFAKCSGEEPRFAQGVGADSAFYPGKIASDDDNNNLGTTG
jgi:hypothetical protein